MAIIQTLGVASCLGGPMKYCGYTAEMLRDEIARQKRQKLKLQWHMLYPEHIGTKEQKLARLNESISHFTEYWTKRNYPFLLIGGDHSCAMGTWAGALNALQPNGQFGLIWLDAHMDAHRFPTSPSGNVHGMPVAALLGKADRKLAAMYPSFQAIKPENLILIGVRNYETEEYELLKQTGVNIIFAQQIKGFAQVLYRTVNKLSRVCPKIGISIDMDVIDPEDAPGVETPVNNGIRALELLEALSLIHRHPKICGLELSELSPEHDLNNKTLHLMMALIEAFYKERDCSLETRRPNKFLGSSSTGSKGRVIPS